MNEEAGAAVKTNQRGPTEHTEHTETGEPQRHRDTEGLEADSAEGKPAFGPASTSTTTSMSTRAEREEAGVGGATRLNWREFE
jgi:hypothetical protein